MTKTTTRKASPARSATKSTAAATTAKATAGTKSGGKRGSGLDPALADLAVGERLRKVREGAGFSQRELAQRAGVTNATVSLIEQQNHAPSLASLHRLLSAIPISIADFFALPTTRQNILFYDKADLTAVTRGAANLQVLGSERRDKKLQLFFERYAPGAGTGEELLSHDGETAAVVVQGLVEIEVGTQRRRIAAGGGFQFIGKQRYRLTNIGPSTAIVVCACTPPMI